MTATAAAAVPPATDAPAGAPGQEAAAEPAEPLAGAASPSDSTASAPLHSGSGGGSGKTAATAPSRGKGGKGGRSGGARQRKAAAAGPAVCQADGCGADLSGHTFYHQRNKCVAEDTCVSWCLHAAVTACVAPETHFRAPPPAPK